MNCSSLRRCLSTVSMVVLTLAALCVWGPTAQAATLVLDDFSTASTGINAWQNSPAGAIGDRYMEVSSTISGGLLTVPNNGNGGPNAGAFVYYGTGFGMPAGGSSFGTLNLSGTDSVQIIYDTLPSNVPSYVDVTLYTASSSAYRRYGWDTGGGSNLSGAVNNAGNIGSASGALFSATTPAWAPAELTGVTGISFKFYQYAFDSYTIDQIQLNGNVAVPEPSSLALAGMGLVGLGWFGWKRRQR